MKANLIFIATTVTGFVVMVLTAQNYRIYWLLAVAVALIAELVYFVKKEERKYEK